MANRQHGRAVTALRSQANLQLLPGAAGGPGSKAEIQNLLDLLPTMIWCSDAKGRETFFNQAWVEFTGVEPGSSRLFSPLALIHPEDRAKVQGAWKRAIATGESYESEYRLRHHSGAHRWVITRARPDQSEPGKVTAWYGQTVDVDAERTRAAKVEDHARELARTLDSIPEKVWVAGADGQIEVLNTSWLAELGRPCNDELVQWTYAIHPDDHERAVREWAESVRTGRDHEIEVRLKRPHGEYSWALLRARPHRDADGDIQRWFGTAVDIDQWVRDRNALRSRENMVREIVQASPDAIQLLDADGRFIFINGAAGKAYGIEHPAELIGCYWIDHVAAEHLSEAERLIAAAKKGEQAAMVVDSHQGGRTQWWEVHAVPICKEDPGSSRILITARNITERKDAEAQVLWAAQHDPVTGLANRALLQTELEKRISEARLTGTRFSLFLFDLDNFKQTNDTLGHDAGDALLREFGRRLTDAVRPSDFVARLGGDEFAILRAGSGYRRDTQHVGLAILAALGGPFTYRDSMIDCRSSVGGASYPEHGQSPAELLKSADMALYSAKRAGRGVLHMFEPHLRDEVQRRSSMISLARGAIDEDRVLPFYQPKVFLRTGEIVGFEALLRWRDANGAIHKPDRIQAAFQDHRLAAEISDRMIEQVLDDLKIWAGAGISFGHVAVNASAAEFRSGTFAERLLERLHAAGLPPHVLQLEVTETVFLGRGAECVEHALKLLSREGVSIALDDFGTGYASLSHLKQFPVDIIKIDQSFVRDLHADPDDGAIVAAVINLARSLNIRVVAEGIETEAQHNTLLALGCDYGQGYRYGHAVPADAAVARLSADKRSHHLSPGALRRLA